MIRTHYTFDKRLVIDRKLRLFVIPCAGCGLVLHVQKRQGGLVKWCSDRCRGAARTAA